ncbi:hypothetical protein D9758_005335 [Tetrapyrgos nigripes]|uniref:DUF6534 domain-containing protein n=1 Tax=Tetrapyrgos nigripes TaxID=182062 RepID=A0A8H5LQ29_9AGAR|nr:hypothetical protein D9758_005335 [Tetrapyrgos nigripes]
MDGLALTRRFFDDINNVSAEELSALTDVPLVSYPAKTCLVYALRLMLGPKFLGYVFSYLLQGILVLQVFIYFIAFPRDSWWIKMTVGFLFFVECLSTFFATFAAAWSIVADGDLFSLANLWGFRTLGPLCGIATLTVHAFYSWRILQVKGHWSIPALIILLSIAQCVMVIWSGTQSFLGIGTDHPSQIAFVTVWLAGSAICDFIIAGSLLVLLPKAAQKLGNAESQSRLERLMKFVVETGMITALGALSELLFFFLFRNTMIHFILFYMLPKVYSNCMLAALNARISSRALRTHDSEWGSQTSIVQEPDRFVIGDGVFHIINRDGKLVPLEEDVRKLSDEHEQYAAEMVDTNAPYQETFVPALPKEPVVVAANARATALFHSSTETLAVTVPRPLPQLEFSASDPILRDSHPRSLPIPPIIVSFSDPVSSAVASAQQLYQPDPIPSVLHSRSFSEPVLPEFGHKDPSISPDSPLVSRLHPFTLDVSDTPSSYSQ